MRSLKSSGKQKRRKLLAVRRVHGRSMMPLLNPEQIVIAYGFFRTIRPNDIVLIEHDTLEKIKRVRSIHEDMVYLVGDNPAESTDSRQFGALPVSCICAKVIN